MLKVEMANNNQVNHAQDQAKVVRDGDDRVRDKVVLNVVVKMDKLGDKVVKEMDTNKAEVKVVSMDRVVSMDKDSLNMDKMVNVQVDKLLMVKMDDQTLEINNMNHILPPLKMMVD